MAWVDVKGNDQLEAERKKAAGESQDPPIQLSPLTGDIRRKWEQAKRAKITIEQRFLKAKRQRDGQYEPSKLAAIQATFGSDYIPVYMMLTETKCRAAESWIKDILLQPDDDPWDIQPTPLPDLPPEIEQQIMQHLLQNLYSQAILMTQERNIPFDLMEFKQTIQGLLPSIKSFVKRQIKGKAKEAAKAMREKIADQFAEGGWYDALEDCIFDIVTYGICFLKGPIANKDLLRKRNLNQMTGKWTSSIESEIIPKWQRRSPFNVYPAPDSVGVDDGYVFDLMNLTPKTLSDLIGVPGYNDAEIEAALKDYRDGGLREWTAIASEKARLEQREQLSVYEGEKIDCLHYMGSAQGQHLLDWGLDKSEIDNPVLEYSIEAWLIGTHVIKAMVNADPLGKKPISKACFNDDPDSFWGRGGVPPLIEDIQTICNAIARAIVNNVGIAAGPQVEFDKDRLGGNAPVLVPWKVWQSTGNQMAKNKAIQFYMPPLIADRLQALYEFFLSLADEDSGIPRYAHGESAASGGAEKTASGLSMLMTHAARGVKMFVKNIDRGAIKTSVERQFYYNLDYEDLPDDMLGDCKIVPRGSSSMIAKEQQAVRRTEFMNMTNNPVDMQIIGLKGRKYLLEETAKSLEIDTDPLFDEFEFESDAFGRVGAGQPAPMGVATQPASPGILQQVQPNPAVPATRRPEIVPPQQLDYAGNPVAGQNAALFAGARQ